MDKIGSLSFIVQLVLESDNHNHTSLCLSYDWDYTHYTKLVWYEVRRDTKYKTNQALSLSRYKMLNV